MQLTSENYFSQEANMKYLSVSQYKSFLTCEAMTMAHIKGEYSSGTKEALLFGNLLHSWNEGEEAFNKWKQHPDIIAKTGKNKGNLKACFQQVYTLIDRIKDDKLFKKALEGEKEKIFTAELFGIPFKVCIDSYNPDKGYFTDLKSMANLTDTFWDNELQTRVGFIQHYKYDLQMVVYAEIEKLANKRNKPLTPYLAAVTKQTPPDAAIYKGFLNYSEVLLMDIKEKIPRIIDLKNGLVKPKMCGKCEYCRSIKETEIIEYVR